MLSGAEGVGNGDWGSVCNSLSLLHLAPHAGVGALLHGLQPSGKEPAAVWVLRRLQLLRGLCAHSDAALWLSAPPRASPRAPFHTRVCPEMRSVWLGLGRALQQVAGAGCVRRRAAPQPCCQLLDKTPSS